MKNKIVTISLLLSMILVGCGSNNNPKESITPSVSPTGGSSGAIETVHVESISLNRASLEIYLDDTNSVLTPTILPENATDKSVNWTSSDSSVATVSGGRITPLKVGTTTITATTVDGNKKATCALTVKQNITIPNYVLYGLFKDETEWTDKQMTINPSSTSEYMIQGIKLYEGDLFKIHMYGDTWYGYSDIKNSTASGLVTRGASNDNIKVLTTGVYDIYSDFNESDGGHIYLAKVGGGSNTNIPVTGVSLNRSGKLLTYRITDFYLTATVSPYNATNKEVIWSSSDTSIATVTSAGRIETKEKTGTTTITVKTVDGNKTAECLIYVKANGRPDYYLTGIINGYTVSTGINNAGTYTYPALPLSTNHYLIPDVDLISGDKLVVRANVGNISPLKDKYNQTYEYKVTKDMSVNIYLNTDGLSCNYNYLTLVEKDSTLPT